MSAASGISASPKLADDYAAAVESNNVRFLKISIQKESLVSDGSWPPSGKLSDDLSKLSTILTDNDPAYILAKLDGKSEWLFITYVPDTAKARDKMVYASTRNALTKALGGDRITDNIFATSKADVTPEAYSAHLRHLAAPKPMSAREKELESIKAAERQSAEAFEGSRARKTHIGAPVGFAWSSDAEKAIKDLGAGVGGKNLVVLNVDIEAESLNLVKTDSVTQTTLTGALPGDEPSFAFYMWQPSKLVFIYSCPSSSKVKPRMIYSSGAMSVVLAAQERTGLKVVKRLETSDPEDLDMNFFTESPTESATHSPDTFRSPAFSRPRGPARRPQ